MKIEWQPILRRMEKTPNLPALDNVNQILVDSTFDLATDYLKSNVCSFLFLNNKKRIENWTLATWSKCTQYSYIKKNGSAVDISNLPVGKRENIPHTKNRTARKKSRDGNAPAPKHILMLVHPPSRVVKNTTRNKGANKRKANGGILRKKKTPRRKTPAEIEQVGTSFAAAFPPPKSPHHHCTYSDCQIEGHMLYKKSSETCNKETCSLELHHVCMIEYGTKTYGEEGGERMGMKKLCKSCMIKTATDMGIKML